MTATAPNVLGTITITVTDQSVQYDTGAFSLPDLVFWMEVVKTMILTSVTNQGTTTDQPVELTGEEETILVPVESPKRADSPLG